MGKAAGWGVAGGAWGLYRLASTLAATPLALYVRSRRWNGKEHPIRWRERFGYTDAVRPAHVPLVWFHAVSVGECAAALPLVARTVQQYPSTSVLLTHGTVSAASFIQHHLPPHTITQYAPLDTPFAVRRFLAHWQPDCGVFLESELWPNLVLTAHRDGIPLALVNANMSPRSAARWGAPPLREAVKRLLGAFTVVSPQTAVAATRLAALGVSAHQLTPPSNLKYAAAATTAAKRPVVKRTRWWVAGSTHPGEEDAVLHVHELTVRRWHDLVTVVVPRHPERAAQVQALAAARGLACMVVDAADGLIELVAGVGVYVVRSIGQLSALYSQAPVAFVGGSLLPTGRGHNVAEAAMVGCAVLVGRHTGPFAGMVRELRQLNSAAVWEVEDTQTLATALGQLLADATRLDDAQQAARQAVQAAHHGTLERTWTTLDMRVLSKALSVSYSGREPHT